MDREMTRRLLLGALVGGGVAGAYLSPARDYLDQFAPLTGSVWQSARSQRNERVDSPYGPADVRYDDEGVPHVNAEDEQALYFAVGYTQATDRLFQMDFQRRLFRGKLSAVAGDVTVESDRFHRQMAFGDAADATAEHIRETDIGPVLDAYTDGVNAAMEREQLPLEFSLLAYEPEPWTLADTTLIEKIIAWQLTGNFRTLRRARIRDEFGADLTAELYPSRFDHDVPIIRDTHDTPTFGDEVATADIPDGSVPSIETPDVSTPSAETALVDWLGQFEPADNLGSNSWVISPEYTGGDAPILSNDPHLSLQAPPVWYEMHIDGPDHRVRGVAFPGEPFVVIGENDHGAWGFTNAGADVIDFYRYDHDGETYRYGDDRRRFDTRTETIEVAGGRDRTVEVRKTVHGPVVEESEQRVGVSWVGHTATETTLSLYDLTHSEGIDDILDAVERFESPNQNLVYADREGNTLYYMTGRIPIRRTDGEPVRGDQIFDGSAREGEWDGFEPFGRSTWDGFVPVSEHPHVVNPDYLATANQQIVPDEQVGYYLAESYASPYRGRRIYELLDDRAASGEPMDIDFLRTLARDRYDGRAEQLVEPLVETARTPGESRLDEAADLLEDWDYRMSADSRAALLFVRWFDTYRNEILADAFDEFGLDESYYPSDGAIAHLPRDSHWFGPRGRARTMRVALRDTLAEIDASDADVYGDIAHTGRIEHPLGLDFLGYPEHPRGGSGQTVWNFAPEGPWGGSWEMHADFDGKLLGLLPGGNSGRYFSPHYDDQIRRWANGRYRELSRTVEGELTVRFREGNE